MKISYNCWFEGFSLKRKTTFIFSENSHHFSVVLLPEIKQLPPTSIVFSKFESRKSCAIITLLTNYEWACPNEKPRTMKSITSRVTFLEKINHEFTGFMWHFSPLVLGHAVGWEVWMNRSDHNFCFCAWKMTHSHTGSFSVTVIDFIRARERLIHSKHVKIWQDCPMHIFHGGPSKTSFFS